VFCRKKKERSSGSSSGSARQQTWVHSSASLPWGVWHMLLLGEQTLFRNMCYLFYSCRLCDPLHNGRSRGDWSRAISRFSWSVITDAKESKIQSHNLCPDVSWHMLQSCASLLRIFWHTLLRHVHMSPVQLKCITQVLVFYPTNTCQYYFNFHARPGACVNANRRNSFLAYIACST
jgi:hypothetical protein